MRFPFGLAIVFCLSLPTAGRCSSQQDPAGATNTNAPAPAATPSTQNAPAEQTPVETTPVETTPAAPTNPQPPTVGTEGPDSAGKKKTPAGTSRAVAKHHKRTARTLAGGPKKIVVREGGATEPAAQIVPGMTPSEAARERQNAEKWLGSTDDQLRQLAGRTLDTRQQEMVGQIRNYIGGARSALKEGDVGRANTLAQKAHLLSEDLVKH